LGYTHDELTGRPVSDIETQAPAETIEALWPTLKEAGVLHVGGRHRRKDGSEFPVAVQIQYCDVGGEELALVSARELPTDAATYDTNGQLENISGFTRDVTDENLARQALSESESRYALGEKIGRFGTWHRDIATGVLTYTDGVYDVLGVSKTDYPHTHDALLALIHPEDRDFFEQTILEWQTRNESYEYDHRIVRPDGEIRYVHQRSEPIFDKDGRLVARRGIIQDITARKQAENRLEQAHQRETLVRQQARIGYWEWACQEDRTEWDAETCRIFGYQPGDVTPSYDLAVSHILPEDRHLLHTAEQQGMQPGQSGYEVKYRLMGADGVLRHVRDRGVITQWHNNEPVYMTGILEDISAQAIAEEQLARAETRLAQARKFARIGLWEWVPETGALTWDDETWRIFGLEPGSAALTYEFAATLVHPDDVDQQHANDQTTIDNQLPEYETEYRIVHPSGEIRRVREQGVLSRDEAGEVLFLTGIIQDVTESRAAQAELAQVQQRFSQARSFADIGLWEWTPKDGGMTWDDATWRIFGYEPGTHDLDYDFVVRHVLPDDHAGMRSSELSVLDGQADEYDCEYRIETAAGEIRHLREAAVATRNEAGEIIYLTGATQNVTDAAITAAALKASQQQLQAITDNLPAMVGYIDRERRYRFVNEAYEKAYGIPRAEIIGMHYVELLGAAAVAEMKPNFDRAFDGEAVAIDISRHYRETGTRHMGFQFRPDFDEASTVRGVYILGNDITDRKASETALQKSESRLRDAQRVARLGEWDRDLVNDTLTISKNLYEIFGVTPDTFTPSPAALLELVHPEDKEVFNEYSSDRVSDTEVFRYDHRVVRPDGRIIHVETRSEPVTDEAGTVIARHGIIQDVTAQKQAAEALRESEARLAQAQTLSNIGSWYRDLVSGEQEYSEEMFRLLGVDRHTYIPTTDAYAALMHPDDRDSLHQYSYDASARPEEYHYEHRIIRPDGEIRYMHHRSSPVFDDHGTVIARRGTTQDITERKLVELALLQSEARVADAQRFALFGNWEWNIETNELFWSEANYLISGRDPKTFSPTYLNFLEIIHPDDRMAVSTAVDEAVRNNTSYQVEHRVVRPNGEIRWVVERGELFAAGDGKPRRMVGSIQDITERKEIEIELEFSQYSLDSAHDALLRCGVHGEILYANPAACDSFGYTSAEILQLTVMDVNPEIDANDLAAQWVQLRKIGALTIDSRHRRKDGSTFPVSVTVSYVKHGDEEFTFVSARDTTAETEAKAALDASQKRLSIARRHTGFGLWEWNPKTDKITWSDETFLMMGFDPADGAPDHEAFMLRVHPDDRDRNRRALASALETDNTYNDDYRIVLPDGEVRYLSDHGIVTRDADDEVLYFTGICQDVTDEKAAEERLRQTEERLAVARRHVGMGTWEWDINTGASTWSDETFEIYGFEPGAIEPTYALYESLLHPDDVAHVHACEQKAFDSESGQFTAEYRIITTSGELKYLYDGGVIFRDDAGQPVAMTGVIQDITDRKLAEQDLRDSENRLALAQRMAHIGSAQRDLSTGIASWSDETYAILGLNPATYDPSTEDFHNLVHPDDRQYFSTYYDAAITDEKPYSIDFRIVRPNGEIRNIHVQSEPGYDASGHYLFRRATMQDVTERKRAEQAVVESERLYRSILDNMVDTFYRTDTEGNVVMASRSAEKLLGYTMVEVLGQKLSAFYANPEQRDDFLEKVRESTTGILGYEAEMIAKGGRSVWVSTNARHWTDADGTILGIEGTVRDVTEAHEVSEQLRQAQKMEAVGQLTGGIAHDFNNMLAVVMGNIEIAIEDTDDGSRTNTMLRATLTRTERGAELVKRLLSFSRKQALAPSVVRLDEVVQSMTSMFGQMLGETIRVTTRSVDGLWSCKVDRGEIENALLNLTINARDAMPDGGMITIASGNATLDDEGATALDMAPGDYSTVTVTDVGTGMTTDVLEHVLEPFYTTKGVGEGSGLGLPMVYGFVKQSGGGMRIETEPGEGTTITLYLPRAGKSVAAPTSDEQKPTEDSSGQTVLVVEDDEEVRVVAVSMISGMGYKFIEAENALQAMQVLAGDDRIDVLFTDVIMPGKIRGPQLAVEAHKMRPGLKVILTTGYNDIVDTDVQAAGLEFGLLRKPYRRAALAKALSDVLATSEPS